MSTPIHEVAVSRHIGGKRQPRRSGVDAALADLAAGRMVVLCDDTDRGGEGDLLLAAEHAGAAEVNFMAKEARGPMLGLALAAERADELGLAPIGTRGNSRLGDASMVSIEARDGVSTGISAPDRARTIAVAADPASSAKDLVQPGHVFPLRARPGGVLEREGRIEAAVELIRAAGMRPAGALCQVMGDDGHMARGEDLERFAERYGLAIVRVSEVVAHRRGSERRPPAQVPDPGRQMRDVMGHFATGVTVVTARGADGVPVGTTANAISSVSLRPPLLLACLAEGSETLAAIGASGSFAVNVLGRHQRDHSDRFAAKGAAARAHEVAFEEHSLGVPVLPDSLATVACKVEAIHPAGDHQIVVGLAHSLKRATAPGAEPLLYYRGAYPQLTIEEDELAA